jgi:hypothetical protein
VNLIHSEASPEELSEDVSDSEVFGTSSSSAVVEVPSILASGYEDEGTVGSAC